MITKIIGGILILAFIFILLSMLLFFYDKKKEIDEYWDYLK